MGSPHQTASCPVCGTRAHVDPATSRVRPHLRKGGVACDGKATSSRVARLIPPFARRRGDDAAPPARAAAAPAKSPARSVAKPAATATAPAAGATASGTVRIRVDCPVCGRFSAVDPEDIRIRLHRTKGEKKCPGSGTFPEVSTLTVEGISVAEVRQRRKDAMARRAPATAPTRSRGLLRRRRSADSSRGSGGR